MTGVQFYRLQVAAEYLVKYLQDASTPEAIDKDRVAELVADIQDSYIGERYMVESQ